MDLVFTSQSTLPLGLNKFKSLRDDLKAAIEKEE